MAKRTFSVRRYRDGTVVFRFGRYVENISADRGYLETYEALKFAAITAGLQLTQKTLEELFRIARGLERV